jgi:hypothetical protein
MAWRKRTTPPRDAMRVHLPPPTASPRGGRPRGEDRRCFAGLQWRLWTGAHGRALPRRDGRPRTCWRRLHHGQETGLLRTLWRASLAPLHAQPPRRGEACVADGRFIPAQQGGPRAARPRGARARRGGWWPRARVLRGEHPWRRRPRRKSPGSNSPSRRSSSAGQGSRGGRASTPNAGSRSAAMTALPGARGWPGGAVHPSARRGGAIRMPPLQLDASGDAIAAGGGVHGHGPGWGTFGVSSSAMNG